MSEAAAKHQIAGSAAGAVARPHASVGTVAHRRPSGSQFTNASSAARLAPGAPRWTNTPKATAVATAAPPHPPVAAQRRSEATRAASRNVTTVAVSASIGSVGAGSGTFQRSSDNRPPRVSNASAPSTPWAAKNTAMAAGGTAAASPSATNSAARPASAAASEPAPVARAATAAANTNGPTRSAGDQAGISRQT